MTTSRLFSFVGGTSGVWKVRSLLRVAGESLPAVDFLDVRSNDQTATDGLWTLRGITSNERYVTRSEKTQLVEKQEALGRPDATYAALIPIRKSPAWWMLTQEERREIFETQSHHTAVGLEYLPAIARRLHHCRDLSESEPFDFLTWFEYAPQDEPAFEQLLVKLRSSIEWTYVDREVDIRLQRASNRSA